VIEELEAAASAKGLSLATYLVVRRLAMVNGMNEYEAINVGRLAA
jgi:hypothetical protein